MFFKPCKIIVAPSQDYHTLSTPPTYMITQHILYIVHTISLASYTILFNLRIDYKKEKKKIYILIYYF